LNSKIEAYENTKKSNAKPDTDIWLMRYTGLLVFVGLLQFFTFLWQGYHLSKSSEKAFAQAKEISDREQRRQVVAKFKSAFASAIGKYKIIPDNRIDGSIDTMLRDELPSQSIAIEEFRWFIAPEKAEAYQKAWEEYHLEGGGINFTNYWMRPPDVCRNNFKTKIEAILEFAKG